jgi:outer membrane protein OmpA-like peptidoglycan-associated protein
VRTKRSFCASFATMILVCGSTNAAKCLGTAEIYFQPNSAVITIDGVKRIDSLLGKMRQADISLVIALGYADKSENPRSGVKALARAASVANLVMERRPNLRNAVAFDGDGGEQSGRRVAVNNRRVSLEISCVSNDNGHYISPYVSIDVASLESL